MGQSSWGYCKEADGVKYVLLCRAVCGEMFYTEQQTHRDAPERAREQGKQSVLANPDKARRVLKHFKVTDTITARCAFRQWQIMTICTFSVASPQFLRWPLCPKNLYVVSSGFGWFHDAPGWPAGVHSFWHCPSLSGVHRGIRDPEHWMNSAQCGTFVLLHVAVFPVRLCCGSAFTAVDWQQMLARSASCEAQWQQLFSTLPSSDDGCANDTPTDQVGPGWRQYAVSICPKPAVGWLACLALNSVERLFEWDLLFVHHLDQFLTVCFCFTLEAWHFGS